MCLSAILLYRTVRVAVRQPDGALMTTEGREQQLLYIQQDGTIGGTGNVAIYLMRDEMISVRTEIIRFSAHPVCNYVWEWNNDFLDLRVRFTSPWQPFAQLALFPFPERSRCTATACFSRNPGEVAVRMGPSGRRVGTATQTLVAGYGSPIACSIDIDIVEDDSIVIFQPDDPTLAPVLSQTFPRPPFGWNTETAQLNPYFTHDPFNMSDQDNTVYETETGNRTGNGFPYWNSGVSACLPEACRQSRVSHQYRLPHADKSSPASESTLSIGSEHQSSSVFVTMHGADTQHDSIDDSCIVVKLLP
ncbi:hypothetical protein CLIM01_14890 [Colletotrichum limetticola]|uniref:Uncharacterized protein n=1 Tax=Colletotrichum limetticola TaxID=1209924 RepID=A0ABQ9P801_9PEZI|nr:hypothetical protein CLIM01_14890 [Colletotrichum limetticola]